MLDIIDDIMIRIIGDPTVVNIITAREIVSIICHNRTNAKKEIAHAIAIQSFIDGRINVPKAMLKFLFKMSTPL